MQCLAVCLLLTMIYVNILCLQCMLITTAPVQAFTLIYVSNHCGGLRPYFIIYFDMSTNIAIITVLTREHTVSNKKAYGAICSLGNIRCQISEHNVPSDELGDHSLCCAYKAKRNTRHNSLRNAVTVAEGELGHGLQPCAREQCPEHR